MAAVAEKHIEYQSGQFLFGVKKVINKAETDRGLFRYLADCGIFIALPEKKTVRGLKDVLVFFIFHYKNSFQIKIAIDNLR